MVLMAFTVLLFFQDLLAERGSQADKEVKVHREKMSSTAPVHADTDSKTTCASISIVHMYPKYSNERRGAHFFSHCFDAALIWVRRSFGCGAYLSTYSTRMPRYSCFSVCPLSNKIRINWAIVF